MSNTLADFADDDVAGRLPVVQEIKALTKEIAATYQEPKQTLQPPKGGAPMPANPMEALQQMHNVRSNITKWGKKAEAAKTPDDKAKAMAKVEELIIQRIKLQAIIDDATTPTA